MLLNDGVPIKLAVSDIPHCTRGTVAGSSWECAPDASPFDVEENEQD